MRCMITVFEEYASDKEKRAAQKGAKRGKPTGKARGYFFAFTCNGWVNGSIDGVGSVFDVQPGGPPQAMGSCSSSRAHLRERCRRVGARHLPPEWKKEYDHYRKED